jgi:Na+-transporting NADH:ubiquinone oxidoreductase subunit D
MANKDPFSDAFFDNNPVIIQMLGICSALAVTTQLKSGLVMAVALTLVITLSNLSVSLLRNIIPSKIRMIVELVIIATLVIMADQLLKAFLFDTSKELSVFVGLIITNCIVMGRAEAFALGNTPKDSILDGLGNGLGYGVILILVSVVREIFGSGKILGTQIIPQSLYDMGYINMGLLVLAPGAFFLIALIAWGQKQYLITKGRA